MARLLSRRARSNIRRLLVSEAAGGIALIAAAALALLVANSPWSAAYFRLLALETGPVLSPAIGAMSVQLWINDGLMAVFFLLVGLEIKRELIDGQLTSAARRRLPVIAAAAGMVCPALLYLAITGGAAPLRAGWAIPAATDIAFAIGVLALAGPRVPTSLKLLLTTIAIVDDIGAVAIIALFYGDGLVLWALLAAVAVLAGMVLMNRGGVITLTPYLVGAALLWWLVLLSGVHATVAGVAAALTVPIRRSPGAPDDRGSALHTLEHALSPWSAFGVVPLFGFANAGVDLRGIGLAALTQPLVVGIALALFLGKQIGVLGGIRAAVGLELAKRPARAHWHQVYGMALLAGIGFTMSLFIGGLAFPGNAAVIDAVKIGVLAGSLLSAITGFVLLRVGRPIPTLHRSS